MLVLAKHVAAPALTLQAWIDISFLISLIHGKKHLLASNFESWSRVMFQENSLSAMFTSFQRQLAWQASQTGEDGYKITDETNNSGCSSCCMLWQFEPHKDVQCHLKTSPLFFLFSFLFFCCCCCNKLAPMLWPHYRDLPSCRPACEASHTI